MASKKTGDVCHLEPAKDKQAAHKTTPPLSRLLEGGLLLRTSLTLGHTFTFVNGQYPQQKMLSIGH
eukprot:7614658-Karenia_brevis.AAC.1